MEIIKIEIKKYLCNNPNEEVLIISDHGISTVKKRININLEKYFGKQNEKSYIAYVDSAIMCIWCNNLEIKDKISAYLRDINEGHLLCDEERKYYGVSNSIFGDIIYILKEGNVFEDNWFGKSLRRRGLDGESMHGFWPDDKANDQLAIMAVINYKCKLKECYTYREAYELINSLLNK